MGRWVDAPLADIRSLGFRRNFDLEQFGVDIAERSAAFILLGVMVLVAAIWQSTGLGVARVHALLNGIDLEPPLRERNSKEDDSGK